MDETCKESDEKGNKGEKTLMKYYWGGNIRNYLLVRRKP